MRWKFLKNSNNTKFSNEFIIKKLKEVAAQFRRTYARMIFEKKLEKKVGEHLERDGLVGARHSFFAAPWLPIPKKLKLLLSC